MGIQETVNTHDQLVKWNREFGEKFVAISPRYTPGRTPSRNGWAVWSPWKTLDPDAAWYDYGHMCFNGFALGSSRKEGSALALIAAQTWAQSLSETKVIWVRNRMGDYIPEQVNKAFPLRKRARLKVETQK